MTRNNRETLKSDWPKASNFKRSIRIEFAFYVSGLIIVLMLITGYIISNQYVNTVTQNVIDKLLVQTRSFSGPAGKLILATDTPDALLLNNICRKLSDDNPDVYWAGITATDDVFMAHTDIKQVISGARMYEISSNQHLDALRKGEVFDLRPDTILIKVPIVEKNVQLGKFVVAASTEAIDNARTRTLTSVITITVIMILIGMPITLFILHRKLGPVREITNSLRKVDFENISINIPLKSKNEFGYLAETMRVMGNRINLAQREIIEKERISRELEIASEIQSNILPRKFPKTSNFEFSGIYSSAFEVGGDYYDFIDIDDNHIAFLVADVSGKSLPGMLVMLLIRDIVKQLARKIEAPAKLLSEANRELLANIKKGMFVTMFYGVLNKKSGEFQYASAGHNPLIRYNQKARDFELIKTKGYPLGMMPADLFDNRLEAGHMRIGENDWLIQYTDGINEAQNSSKEEFGMERFLKSIESGVDLNPLEMINSTMAQLKNFVGDATQYDDITLLAIKWTGQNSVRQATETKEAAFEN